MSTDLFASSELSIGGKTGQAHIIQLDGTGFRPRPYLNFIGDVNILDFEGKTRVDITAATAGGATTDTVNFDGILSPADTNVQESLDTIDDVVQNTVPCATSDPWCFVESSTGVLDLYMRSQLVQRITIVVSIVYLEDMLGANLEFMDATDIEDMDQ